MFPWGVTLIGRNCNITAVVFLLDCEGFKKKKKCFRKGKLSAARVRK